MPEISMKKILLSLLCANSIIVCTAPDSVNNEENTIVKEAKAPQAEGATITVHKFAYVEEGKNLQEYVMACIKKGDDNYCSYTKLFNNDYVKDLNLMNAYIKDNDTTHNRSKNKDEYYSFAGTLNDKEVDVAISHYKAKTWAGVHATKSYGWFSNLSCGSICHHGPENQKINAQLDDLASRASYYDDRYNMTIVLDEQGNVVEAKVITTCFKIIQTLSRYYKYEKPQESWGVSQVDEKGEVREWQKKAAQELFKNFNELLEKKAEK